MGYRNNRIQFEPESYAGMTYENAHVQTIRSFHELYQKDKAPPSHDFYPDLYEGFNGPVQQKRISIAFDNSYPDITGFSSQCCNECLADSSYFSEEKVPFPYIDDSEYREDNDWNRELSYHSNEYSDGYFDVSMGSTFNAEAHKRLLYPGRNREFARFAGWKQKWRTIGYYLDEFQEQVPQRDLDPQISPGLYNELTHDLAHYLMYKTGARYGRSVAAILRATNPGAPCSSWLAGGPFLLSAAHCGHSWHRGCLARPNGFRISGIPRVEYSASFDRFGSEDFIVRRNLSVPISDRARELGETYLEQRLRALGIPQFLPGRPRTAAAHTPFWQRIGFLDSYSCFLESTSNSKPFECRDINIYKCDTPMSFKDRSLRHLGIWDPLTSSALYQIQVDEEGQRNLVDERVQLPASIIWGSIPIMPQAERRDCKHPQSFDTCHSPIDAKIIRGRDIYAVSYNQPEVYTRTSIGTSAVEQVLLSYGGTIQQPQWHTAVSKSFLGQGLYWEGGSSGGVVMDRRTNRAMGVISGWKPYRDINFLRPNASLDTQIVSSNFDNIRRNYIRSIFEPNRYPPFREYTRSLGSIGNEQGWSIGGKVVCPKGMVAAGVIGSRGPGRSDRIRNFGMTCIPFGGRPPTFYNPNPRQYLFDLSTVITTGSSDTVRGSVNFSGRGSSPNLGEELNTYLNEVVVHQRLSDLGINLPFAPNTTIEQYPQAFANCPPNYYLRGVRIIVDRNGSPRFIRIPMLYCANADYSRLHTREVPTEGLGALGATRQDINSVSRQGHTIEEVVCPRGNYFVGFSFYRDVDAVKKIVPICARASMAIL